MTARVVISVGLTASHPATAAVVIIIASVTVSHLSRVSTVFRVCLKSPGNRIRGGVWLDEACGVKYRHPCLTDPGGHRTPHPLLSVDTQAEECFYSDEGNLNVL